MDYGLERISSNTLRPFILLVPRRFAIQDTYIDSHDQSQEIGDRCASSFTAIFVAVDWKKRSTKKIHSELSGLFVYCGGIE